MKLEQRKQSEVSQKEKHQYSILTYISLQMVTAAMKLKDAYSFWRKVITNLDSILKSRDITLPTKVHLVKALVLPVVMYGCESWIVKKAEHQELMLLNCGVGEDSLSLFFF